MSRFVAWGGKFWGRGFFYPPLDLPAGACPRCGGLGVVAESIDEERYDVAVACPECQGWCSACRQHVRRSGHVCAGKAKP